MKTEAERGEKKEKSTKSGAPCNKKGCVGSLKHHAHYRLESLRLRQQGHGRKHKEEPQQYLATIPFFSCYFLAEGKF